jgi:septal ring factor EnvC (AmiA/AmiB activator)
VAASCGRIITPRPVIARVALLALLALTPAYADDDSAKLLALRARIEQLEKGLNETRASRDSVREDLRVHDQRINGLLRAQRATATRIRSNSARLEQAHRRARKERAALGALRAGLEQDARAAYVAGRQDYVKLLLNEDDPARLARVAVYYRYITLARSARMRRIHGSLARLDDIERDIRDRDRELSALRAAQSQGLLELERTRKERAALLTSLNREVTSRSREIERLRADEARLERLLGELATAMPDIPLPADRNARFAALRGRLALPVRGHITARFGDEKGLGDLRWRGIVIEAPEGREVTAVARGRVAYAGWLRGFGLLLILDHGDGYMTLYGHNQALLHDVGDWVEAGQAIASVGSTGDASRPGVYFEIRHHGEPADPMRWVGVGHRGVARAR